MSIYITFVILSIIAVLNFFQCQLTNHPSIATTCNIFVFKRQRIILNTSSRDLSKIKYNGRTRWCVLYVIVCGIYLSCPKLNNESNVGVEVWLKYWGLNTNLHAICILVPLYRVGVIIERVLYNNLLVRISTALSI